MNHQPNFLKATCPSRIAMSILADKWSLLILAAISRGVNRNGILLREIGDISQKMLTQTLRALEKHKLIERIVFAEVPPRVEYYLTPLGESLIPIIQSLGEWVERNYLDMEISV